MIIWVSGQPCLGWDVTSWQRRWRLSPKFRRSKKYSSPYFGLTFPHIFPINSPYFPHIHILFFSHFCRLLKFSVSSDFLWSEKGCGQLGTAQKTWLGVETVRSKRLVRKYSKYSTMIFIDFCKNHMDHMDISEVTRYRQFWWLVIIFFLQTPFFGSPILRTPHNISRNWWYRNSTTLRHSGFWTQPGALRHCWDFFLG